MSLIPSCPSHIDIDYRLPTTTDIKGCVAAHAESRQATSWVMGDECAESGKRKTSASLGSGSNSNPKPQTPWPEKQRAPRTSPSPSHTHVFKERILRQEKRKEEASPGATPLIKPPNPLVQLSPCPCPPRTAPSQPKLPRGPCWRSVG
jgi:hypothetical protein